MRARQLEIFRTVMSCGSLTAASTVLNVSQPALSQALRQTEDALGFRLFKRVGRRLIATPEAEQLFPEANRIFEDLQTLQRHAAELKSGRVGTIRMAASAALSLSVLPMALKGFRKSYPGVRLLTYVVPAASVIAMLEADQATIGLTLNDNPHPAVQSETIARCDVVCLLPLGHSLSKKKVIVAADLVEETLISYRVDSFQGQLLAAAMAQVGVVLRPEIEVDVSIAAPALVQAELGIALVDGLLPIDSFPGVVAKPFLPPTSFPICLLHPRRRPLSQLHLSMYDELRSSVALYLSKAQGFSRRSR